MNREIGDLGETFFKILCDQEGFAANPSSKDLNGWDYFVEAPFPREVDNLGIHKTPHQYKVQIKSSETENRTVKFKLSSIHRLAVYNGPSFIVLFHFDKAREPKKTYIKHVDEDLIKRVLEKVAIENAKENSKPINKIDISITFPKTSLVKNEPSLSKNFFHLVNEFIGASLKDYTEKKSKHLDEVGYDENPMKVTFTTQDNEELENLSKLALGLSESATVSNFTIVDNRFGIETPLSSDEIATITMPELKPSSEGKVAFRKDKFSSSIAFDARLYMSPFASMESEVVHTFRIVGGFFEMLANIHSGKTDINYDLSDSTRLKITDFRKAFTLLKMLTGGDSFLIALDFKDFPSVRLNGKGAGQGFLFDQQLKLFESVELLCKEFDLDRDITVTLGDIIDFEQTITSLAKFFSANPGDFKVRFRTREPINSNLNKPFSQTIITQTRIGSTYLALIFTLIGHGYICSDDQIIVTGEKIFIDEKLVFEEGEENIKETIAEIFIRSREKYFDEYHALVSE